MPLPSSMGKACGSSMSCLPLPASPYWLDGKGTVGEMGWFLCGDKGFIVIPKASIQSTDQWPFQCIGPHNRISCSVYPHNYRVECPRNRHDISKTFFFLSDTNHLKSSFCRLAYEEATRGWEMQSLTPNKTWVPLAFSCTWRLCKFASWAWQREENVEYQQMYCRFVQGQRRALMAESCTNQYFS